MCEHSLSIAFNSGISTYQGISIQRISIDQSLRFIEGTSRGGVDPEEGGLWHKSCSCKDNMWRKKDLHRRFSSLDRLHNSWSLLEGKWSYLLRAWFLILTSTYTLGCHELSSFQNEQKNFLYLGGGVVLLQVAQPLAGVECTQTGGHCSWGWAIIRWRFFYESCLLLRIWKYTC